jgi:16S rRNA (adenine1518-N6/adenine1519-N6)-dimethyltransferase
MNLSSPSEIKALLQKNGFNFSKALGQNFLINPSVCPRMAEAAIPGPEYGVIEVGPGIGVLTVELAQRAQKVIAIELDERLYPILDETLADYPNAHVVPGDILEVDLHKLIADEFILRDEAGDPVLDESGAPRLMPLVLCANLPYYITSPVIMKLLSEDLPIENLTVMVQKEAADRLCADVGTRAAGAVTVAIQYYAEAEQLFFVSKGSFLPAPKVDSEVIRLTLHQPGTSAGSSASSGSSASASSAANSAAGAENSAAGAANSAAGAANTDRLSKEDADRFFKMVQAGFSQRRKTIMNSFSAALGMNKADLGELLDSVDVPRTARIEQLTMDQLLAVYKASR